MRLGRALSMWLRALGVALFVLAMACVPEAKAPEPNAEIASLHRARCGACHVRVEPGTRTRDAAALGRHRKRVHLTEAQWAALIDYLAPVPADHAPAG